MRYPINAVWLWGGGRLQRPATRAFARVRSAGPLAAGLAAASGGAVLPLPDDGARWLQSAPGEGVELIVLEQLRAPASYGDAGTWGERLAALERDWFAPLRAALRARPHRHGDAARSWKRGHGRRRDYTPGPALLLATASAARRLRGRRMTGAIVTRQVPLAAERTLAQAGVPVCVRGRSMRSSARTTWWVPGRRSAR